MPNNYDVIVVGAGIVGAACAAEFTEAKRSVAIVERDTIGSGATAAGMGHIVVMDDSEAQFALTRYSQILWSNLREQLPCEVEFEPTGTIWVAADEEEMQEVRRKHAFYAARNVPTEILDASALAKLEPNLRPGLAGGLLVPEDAVLYPPVAAKFLLDQAVGNKAQLFLGRAITSIETGGVLLEDGTRLSSAIVIIATGAVSSELCPGLAVTKRKGHLVITDRYPGFVRHQLVELGYLKSAHATTQDSVAFNVQPRKTGQVLIGSSRQYGAEHSAIDHSIVSAMLDRAREYMPGIGRLNAIRCWTGFRAATPDKLPIIGPLPERKGVFAATGHEGLGITTSLGTAKILANQILRRPSAIEFEPYLPTRVMKEQLHV